jgi:hypothetical protein
MNAQERIEELKRERTQLQSEINRAARRLPLNAPSTRDAALRLMVVDVLLTALQEGGV